MARLGRLILVARRLPGGGFGLGCLLASTALSFDPGPVAQAIAWSLLIASVAILSFAGVRLRSTMALGELR